MKLIKSMQSSAVAAAVAGTLMLAGCASMPKNIPELDKARADVQTLSQDPLAQQGASQELDNARKSLAQAENALKEKEKDDVLHFSYLASQQATTGQQRVAELRSKEQVAQGEADRNRVLLESRTREAEAATASAQEQARIAQTRAAQADDAQRQLQELQAKQTDRGMVLTLGDVLFDTAQATLKPGATTVMDRVAGFLKENEGTKVMVEGHTDSRGSDEYNMGLSERRAQAVADALAFRGVGRDRVEAVGRGKTLPVASNDNAAGQQQNRRVELVFSDASGRFASGANASLR